MVSAIFTPGMRMLLSAMKGHRFISYECEKASVENEIYGNFRINLDDISIDIKNEEKAFPFFDSTEDMSCFSCEKADTNTPFQPAVIADTKTIVVDEVIVSVEIITDEINVNHDEYQVTFDSALIIRTTSKTFMFARDIWFSEVITIAENDDYDKIFSVQKVIDSWSDEGDNEVTVCRTNNIL